MVFVSKFISLNNRPSLDKSRSLKEIIYNYEIEEIQNNLGMLMNNKLFVIH